MAEDYTCSECGAKHEVVWKDTPYSDHHKEDCRNCGEELINQKTSGEIESIVLVKKTRITDADDFNHEGELIDENHHVDNVYDGYVD